MFCTLFKEKQAMAISIKESSKDETRIGEFAAKQPLSGIRVVTAVNVKGFNSTSSLHGDGGIKKSA